MQGEHVLSGYACILRVVDNLLHGEANLMTGSYFKK